MPVGLMRAVVAAARTIELVGTTANLVIQRSRRGLSPACGCAGRSSGRGDFCGDGLAGSGLLGRALLGGNFGGRGLMRRVLLFSHLSRSPDDPGRRRRDCGTRLLRFYNAGVPGNVTRRWNLEGLRHGFPAAEGGLEGDLGGLAAGLGSLAEGQLQPLPGIGIAIELHGKDVDSLLVRGGAVNDDAIRGFPVAGGGRENAWFSGGTWQLEEVLLYLDVVRIKRAQRKVD